MENGLRNRNFSTAINCLLFPFLHILFTCFSHFQNAFFHMFLKSHFQNARFHIFSQNVKTCGKNAFGKKCEKMRVENTLGKKCETK